MFKMNIAASFKEQTEQQENEDTMDIEELRERCKRLKQENQELQCRMQNKEQEIQLQKQSLSNLAVTVVKQDKHIKQLTQHLEDVYKNDNNSRRQSDSYNTEYSGNQSMGEVQGREYAYDMDIMQEDSRGSPFMRTASKRSSTPYSQKSQGSNGKSGNQRVSPLPPTRSPLPPRDGSPTYNLSGHVSPHQRGRRKSVVVDDLFEEDFNNQLQLSRTQSTHRRTKSRQLSLNMRDSSPLFDDMEPRRLQRQSSEQVYAYGMATYRGERERERARGDQSPPMDGHLTARRQLHRTRTSPARGYETHREMRNDFRRSTGMHSRRSKDYDLEFQDERYRQDRSGEQRRSRRSSEQRVRYEFEDFDDDFDVELLKEKIDALENDQLQGGWPLEQDDDYFEG